MAASREFCSSQCSSHTRNYFLANHPSMRTWNSTKLGRTLTVAASSAARWFRSSWSLLSQLSSRVRGFSRTPKSRFWSRWWRCTTSSTDRSGRLAEGAACRRETFAGCSAVECLRWCWVCPHASRCRRWNRLVRNSEGRKSVAARCSSPRCDRSFDRRCLSCKSSMSESNLSWRQNDWNFEMFKVWTLTSAAKFSPIGVLDVIQIRVNQQVGVERVFRFQPPEMHGTGDTCAKLRLGDMLHGGRFGRQSGANAEIAVGTKQH